MDIGLQSICFDVVAVFESIVRFLAFMHRFGSHTHVERALWCIDIT